jgi:hypothetical protein
MQISFSRSLWTLLKNRNAVSISLEITASSFRQRSHKCLPCVYTVPLLSYWILSLLNPVITSTTWVSILEASSDIWLVLEVIYSRHGPRIFSSVQQGSAAQFQHCVALIWSSVWWQICILERQTSGTSKLRAFFFTTNSKPIWHHNRNDNQHRRTLISREGVGWGAHPDPVG